MASKIPNGMNHGSIRLYVIFCGVCGRGSTVRFIPSLATPYAAVMARRPITRLGCHAGGNVLHDDYWMGGHGFVCVRPRFDNSRFDSDVADVYGDYDAGLGSFTVGRSGPVEPFLSYGFCFDESRGLPSTAQLIHVTTTYLI